MEMESQEETIKKARIYTNAAYLLADVCNTFMMQANTELSKIKAELKHEEKNRFSNLLRQAKMTESLSRELSRPMYNINQATQACDDSDWLHDYLMLLIDRTGDNEEKMTKARAMLFNMTSELKLFNQ